MTVRTRVMLSTAFGLVLFGIFALLPLGARSLEPREVVVIARQMSFYSADGVTASPTIRMRPGETIRLTLIVEDPGFDHDFVVTAWVAKTPVLHGKGRTSVVLRAPDKEGAASYVCSIHASMMKGIIEVGAPVQ